ncbi:MAG: hypothetical protein AB7I59_26675 [Geminicoccaceae bacterium]
MSQASGRSDPAPFVWRYLEDRIRDYLSDGGIPWEHASRMASRIIVVCATEADSLKHDAIGEHAFDEAHIQLESWRASRSVNLAEAA